jgi:dihydrofolate reductase
MKLSLIVAAANNNVIGRNNELPWHLPQDLKYFKSVTLGKPVIMGRKTFESIGKPLPGRTNIVITRQSDWQHAGVLVASNVDDALALAENFRNELGQTADEVMVIGGAEIYRCALPLADKIYLTRIDEDIKGDAWFPSLSDTEWVCESELAGDPGASLPHRFLTFRKVS